MDPQLILTIFKGVNMIGTLAPIGIDLAQKIKALFSHDPEVTVTLQQLQEGTIKTADETLAMIEAWNAAHPAE